MDILMIIQYFSDIDNLDKSNNRFIYLGSMLAKENTVEVLTTSFIHATKKHSKIVPTEYKNFKITTLWEPGYKKNVSLKRISSHKVLAKNIKKYLDERKTPDVIYCAIPSLDCAYVAAQYSKRKQIPFIIDIQDLWPEAFKMVFKVPILKDILFYPMDKKADYVYSKADYIIGVSETYCERAKKVNPTANVSSIFIGTDVEVFDNNSRNNVVERNDSNLVMCYCGTLGHSYDLPCVFDAMQIVRDKGYDNVELWVIGRGPLRDDFEKYALERGLNVKFLGWMPYHQMCGVLSSCDVCINPIIKGAAASIINKHGDYAASGLPVINTQECEEYRKLIDKYHCGINCECSNPQSVADAILQLIQNETELKQMGVNARRLAETLFDRKNTYTKIYDALDEVVGKNNKR